MENTQTQFNTDNAPALPVDDKENDNSAASSAGEQTDTTQTPTDGGEQKPDEKKDGSENFADHPRWQQRENDWKTRFNQQEERHIQEIQGLRTEFEQKYGQKPQANQAATTDEIPPWFGSDDQEAWQQFKAWNESLITKAQEGAVQHLTQKQADEQKQITDATNYFHAQVAALEADKELNPNGEKVDRNKLMKFVLDYKLVDTDGKWNWKAGYLAMRGQPQPKAKNNNDRKALAGATTSESRPEPKADEVMGSDDFKKPGARPW